MTRDEQRVAQALADVATIGILQQRSFTVASELADQLQEALDSRVIIEQAKGVLAEFSGQGMSAAFSQLRGYSRRHNRKLAQVAAEVIGGAVDLHEIAPRADRDR